MGCDVHAYAEVKIKTSSGGDWRLVRRPIALAGYRDDAYAPSERNYLLFGQLAGVRTDKYPPISLPKGFPGDDDVSPEVQSEHERWGSDGHSTSWLLLSELLKYLEEDPKRAQASEDFWEKQVPSMVELAKEYGLPHSDVRLVFWFDN